MFVTYAVLMIIGAVVAVIALVGGVALIVNVTRPRRRHPPAAGAMVDAARRVPGVSGCLSPTNGYARHCRHLLPR